MFRLMLPAALLAAVSFATAADDKPITPFNGKDLKGWKLKAEKKSKWKALPGAFPLIDPGNQAAFAENAVGASKEAGSAGSLVNAKGGGTDIFTEEKFGNIHLELEF